MLQLKNIALRVKKERKVTLGFQGLVGWKGDVEGQDDQDQKEHEVIWGLPVQPVQEALKVKVAFQVRWLEYNTEIAQKKYNIGEQFWIMLWFLIYS